MKPVAKALEETTRVEPQTPVDVRPGETFRRTDGGIPVVRLHYDVHPERNSDSHPEWKKQERAT